MNIKSIALYNFRNFSQVEEISFPADTLLIAAAPNATGKTNFLEAVTVLLRGKSWRARHKALVRWQQDYFVVKGEIEGERGSNLVAIQYHSPTKKLKVEENGAPASPVTFYSHLPFVLFLPEDTMMFARGPAMRRNFLNRSLVVNPAYVANLVQYQRSLRQRNLALRSAKNFSDLSAWTSLVVEQGQLIRRQRQQFAEFISSHLNETYKKISSEEIKFKVSLSPTLLSDDELLKKMEENFSAEKRAGYTMAGPHRDDLVVTTDDRAVTDVLSQGQTRSLVVALKLVSQLYVEKITGEKPILLLDEVLSELDEGRQEALLKGLPRAQTIITTTSVPKALRSQAGVHLLDLRTIIKEDGIAPAKRNIQGAQKPEVAGG